MITLSFFFVHDITQSGINFNDDLEKISNCAFQWKIRFKHDINIQAQEVIFSIKLWKSDHPSLIFNGTCVTQFEIEKQLRMFLDSKLNFQEHIQNVFRKVSKTGLLCKLQKN